jgi:hypothetical protein
MKRLQWIEKIKKDVTTTKRFFSEDVKLITRSKKTKNRLIINNFLMKMLLCQHMRCRESSKY